MTNTTTPAVYTVPTSAAQIKADTLAAAKIDNAEHSEVFDMIRDGIATLRFLTTTDGYGRLRTVVHTGVENAAGTLLGHAHPYEVFAPVIEHKSADRRLTPDKNAQRTLRRFLAVDDDVVVRWTSDSFRGSWS